MFTIKMKKTKQKTKQNKNKTKKQNKTKQNKTKKNLFRYLCVMYYYLNKDNAEFKWLVK